jgi:hypothetical protein
MPGGRLCARIRAGHRLVIIDLSVRGALVEGLRPLCPGVRVEVHLECDAQRAMVGARVLRCAVAAIDAESGVTYRAALAFSELCEWIREAATPSGYDLHVLAAESRPVAEPAGDPIPAFAITSAGPPVRGTK